MLARDHQNDEKRNAAIRLLNELEQGQRSSEEEGWLFPDEVRDHFRAKAAESKTSESSN